MKIFLNSNKAQPPTLDLNEGLVSVPSDTKLYINLDQQNRIELRKRHPGELVLRNGWICLDYDAEGFLVGLELVEGDPMTGVTECIDYLQPVNPLIQ